MQKPDRPTSPAEPAAPSAVPVDGTPYMPDDALSGPETDSPIDDIARDGSGDGMPAVPDSAQRRTPGGGGGPTR